MSKDRGVSTTLNYVLGLSVAFILITGLLLSGGGFVQDQREEAMRTELEVLGEQVSADVMRADRLAQTTEDNTTVRVRRDLPPRVAGSAYDITIEGGENSYVVVETVSPEVSVEVQLMNTTAVNQTTVGGGPIAVNYTDKDSLKLESET